MDSQTPVAVLHEVTKTYGSTVAVNGLTLHIHKGEILALLGPNGAGKTSSVRMLMGLTRPTRGTVRVFGESPRQASVRTNMGAMLQGCRVPENLRVSEHIDLFRSYYPNPLPASEVVGIAQLEGLQGRFFGQLSGGQKQRVVFALALCGNPGILLLDEPTVGMDIESRRSLWDRIGQLAASGKAILLTTHYLEEAEALASRVVLLNQGRIAAEGSPSQIKETVHRQTIRCTTSLDPAIVRSLPFVTGVRADHGRLVVETTQADSVVREMLGRDSGICNIEIAGAALEDAVLELTRKTSTHPAND